MDEKQFMIGIKAMLRHIELIDNTLLNILDEKQKREYIKELKKILKNG